MNHDFIAKQKELMKKYEVLNEEKKARREAGNERMQDLLRQRDTLLQNEGLLRNWKEEEAKLQVGTGTEPIMPLQAKDDGFEGERISLEKLKQTTPLFYSKLDRRPWPMELDAVGCFAMLGLVSLSGACGVR